MGFGCGCVKFHEVLSPFTKALHINLYKIFVCVGCVSFRFFACKDVWVSAWLCVCMVPRESENGMHVHMFCRVQIHGQERIIARIWNVCLYMCIYICVCCRVENPSKNCPFLSWKSVQQFPFFTVLFFKSLFFFCRENEIFKKYRKKRKKETIPLKIRPILLRNIIGQIFNATLDVFFLIEKVPKPLFYSVFSQNEILKPTPKKLKNTICEHNCANWFFCPFFCILFFWSFCYVRFFGGLFFERNEKTTKNSKQNKKLKKKKDHKMQTRRPLRLVTKTTT